MRRALQLIGGAALCAGLATGGYRFATAVSNGDGSNSSRTAVRPDTATAETGAPSEEVAIAALPAEGEPERVVWQDDMHSVSFSRADGQMCVTLTTLADRSENFTCGAPVEFATGTAHLAYQQQAADPIIVVGIVPDGVRSVVVDGKPLTVANNLWTSETTKPTVDLRVVDADGVEIRTELVVGIGPG